MKRARGFIHRQPVPAVPIVQETKKCLKRNHRAKVNPKETIAKSQGIENRQLDEKASGRR